MSRNLFPGWYLLLAVLTMTGATGALAETGERWESRMEMSGGDFPAGMPAQTREVCLPKHAASQAPGMDDKSCTLLESSKNGNRARWKAKCQDGSTVSGDFTYQGDSAYKGIVNYQGGEGNMQMKVSGKRFGGSCQLASAPKVPASGMGQACDQALASLNGTLFFGSSASCTAKRKEFCAHLNDMKLEEYASVKEQIEAGRDPSMQAALKGSGVATMEDAVKGCGTTPEALETKACNQAVAQQQYGYVGKHCPTQTAQLKRKQCEGRDYTSLMASGDGEMCGELGFDARSGYKRSARASALATEHLPVDNDTADLIQEGVNQLKGLLSF